MRIIFMGSTLLGLGILDSVLDLEGLDVVGCITAPPDFSISYSEDKVRNVLHADFRPTCQRFGIPLCESANGVRNEGLLTWAKHLEPDAFLVIGWHHMIPAAWLEVAPGYALHASLLPDLAGGAPLVWAILLNRTETGVSLFKLEAGVDTGAIVGQMRFPIQARDTIADLLVRVEHLGKELTLRELRKLRNGAATLVAQDTSRRLVMPQRSPRDGEIDWTVSADYIDRLVRASTKPYPGAFTTWRGSRVIIWSAHPIASGSSELDQGGFSPEVLLAGMDPGSFTAVDEGFVVQCGSGVLRVTDWEIDSQRMPVISSDSPFVSSSGRGQDLGRK